MSDDRLKTQVLQKADADPDLSEAARLTLLAALGDPGDLAEVLGEHATSQHLIDSLNAVDVTAGAPVGAYLKSIAVEGFRGIGAKVTVPIPPGPGLIVIAGRNGSGKSTLAEALELALTGRNSRWKDRAAVWSGSWRNLHHGEPAEIRVGLTEDGTGTTTLGADWPQGHIEVNELKRWVQRAGAKRECTDVLGWDAALEMYRPLLSYDELGSILEGRPSDFYDQLYKLLGLEKLTEAIDRLSAEVKNLRQPGVDLRKHRDRLKPILEKHDDTRAASALAQIKKTKPDLDSIASLIAEGAAAQIPPAWVVAQRLSLPDPTVVEQACGAMQNADHREKEELSRANAQAADRSRLLELALQFHDEHGTSPCPVCERGTLDVGWANSARTALDSERATAHSLMTARAAVRAARADLIQLVNDIPAPPAVADGLSSLPAALDAYRAFADVSDDDLASHVVATTEPLREAYARVSQEASELIQQRADVWAPVAVELAAWLQQAKAVAAAADPLATASEAQKWLQDNANDLRNQRIAPLADRARAIWSALRQESNVSLGKIRLEGRNTSRRVVLEADVDGSDTEAFGVMSQGELQALALAIFIPRATSPNSPFRFIVLDDPIQAMDPSKIDGFLSVLNDLAQERQVIVMTHDDRLPSAIRRSRAPARVIEVARANNSTVSIAESSRPVRRLLDDAFAIAVDEGVPEAIKRVAVPVLCREALESAAWDLFNARAMAKGDSRELVEKKWEGACTVRKRLALALHLDDKADPTSWLSGGSARKVAMMVATKGAHAGISDFRLAVNQTRTATDDLMKEPS